MKKLPIFFLFVSFLLSSNENVSIRLQWFPQAQFAGYYVAKEKAFYEKQGLNVTILPGGPDINGLAEVGQGKSTFATAWLSTGMDFISKGTPIVLVAQVFQKSNLVLVTKKESGIKSIKDLNGRKVGVWSGLFIVPVRAMMSINNLQPTYIKMGFDVTPFVEDKFDLAGEVTSAMLYNEYNTIVSKGVAEKDLLVFNPADYGANFPEDGIYASINIIKSNPAMVKKFIQASIEGWDYAFKNPNETADILIKNGATDKAHQIKMLNSISSSFKRDKKISTLLEKKDFDFVYKTLKESQLLGKKEISYKDFFINIK